MRRRQAEYYLSHLVYFERPSRGKGANTGLGLLALATSAGSSDPAVFVLAWIVSNLRNFFGMTAIETTELIQAYLPIKGGPSWSSEGIGYTWELVADLTPPLAEQDKKTAALRNQLLIENQVTDLIIQSQPGGRTKRDEFLILFKSLYPNTQITKRSLGVAVHAITGKHSYPSKGILYYRGFHLPSTEQMIAA